MKKNKTQNFDNFVEIDEIRHILSFHKEYSQNVSEGLLQIYGKK